MNEEAYVTSTPHGLVEVYFEEDKPNRFVGSELAVLMLKSHMASTTNSIGILIDPDYVNPNTYVRCCQDKGSGMVIVEPASATLDRFKAKGRTGK